MRWKGTGMEPAQVLVALIGWALIVTAGYHVGKYKGRETAGLTLTILLGLVGLLILACLPKTQAVKAAEAQRQLPYPPQYPYPPYQYPPPVPVPAPVPAGRTVSPPAAGPLGPASLMTPDWRSR